MTLQCPSCHRDIEPDSAWCRHCGHRVVDDQVDAAAVLVKTAELVVDPVGALDAMETYLRRWPEHPQCFDVRVTLESLRSRLAWNALDKGTFNWKFSQVLPLALQCSDGLPVQLANGTYTAVRIADAALRERAQVSLSILRDVNASAIAPLFEVARDELLKLRAEVAKSASIRPDFSTAMDDCRLHWHSVNAGDLDSAVRGFTYLKSQWPEDPNIRYGLAMALNKQGLPKVALQEMLLGYFAAPDDLDVFAFLLLLLSGFGLYPAAAETVQHFESRGGDSRNPRLQGLALLAKAVTAGHLMATPEFAAGFSGASPDVQEAIGVSVRPWLAVGQTQDANEVYVDLLGQAHVFISYRRQTAKDQARELERQLKGAHPSMHVFRDESSMKVGNDYVEQLAHHIETADVMLVLVDPGWIVRAREPESVLSREIARGLAHQRSIIPVLICGAQMPTEEEMPEVLRPFCRLHAISLTAETHALDMATLEAAMTQACLVARRHLAEDYAHQESEIIRVQSQNGEGLPRRSVVIPGHWTCSAPLYGGVTAHFEFDAEGTDQRPFAGSYWVSSPGLLSMVKWKRTHIKGRWTPLVDKDKELLLGISLDGFSEDGSPCAFRIPIARRLGDDYVGIDANKLQYTSRNVRPTSMVL